MRRDPEERPLLKHLSEEIAAGFERFCIGVYALAAGDLPLERTVIRQNFIVCVP
jgi:hypothetical protein